MLLEAHRLRVARGDYNIDRVHLADAIEALTERSRDSLSEDRSPRDPYGAGRLQPSDLGREAAFPARRHPQRRATFLTRSAVRNVDRRWLSVGV